MLWPWHKVCSIERFGSERPVYGLSEQWNEALHFLAPLGEVNRAVSYGVLLGVSEPIDRAQPLNCLGIARAGSVHRRALRPGGCEGPAELRKGSLFLSLIGRGQSSCFNSFDQLKRAGRTVEGCGGNVRSPDLQADLHRADDGKRRHDQCKYRDADGPTELSSSV